jgi:hypothetical protein
MDSERWLLACQSLVLIVGWVVNLFVFHAFFCRHNVTLCLFDFVFLFRYCNYSRSRLSLKKMSVFIAVGISAIIIFITFCGGQEPKFTRLLRRLGSFSKHSRVIRLWLQAELLGAGRLRRIIKRCAESKLGSCR